MATVKFNSNEQIKKNEQSQVNDSSHTKVRETDQSVSIAPRDRSHTAAVMDTDKS